jgi:hypothetical protein
MNYFTAVGPNDRSSGLVDGISTGIQTILAAAKGVDAASSVMKQMQSNAATNLSKLQSTASLGSANEATATRKSRHDVAVGKKIAGAATPADTTTAGIIGVGVTKVDTFQLKAGTTVANIAFGANDTVNDLVNNINKSGIATASVDNLGQLVITGTNSDTLTVQAGKLDAATGALTADVTETNKLTGGVTTSAAGGSSAQRSALIDQFNSLRTLLDQAVKDAGFNGTNLLNGDSISTAFNEKTGSAQSKLQMQSNALSSSSLGLGTFVGSSAAQAGANFGVQSKNDLTRASDALTNALASLKSVSSTLGSNLSTVQNRQSFTKEMMNVLDTGAANLVSADMNAEAANSQALSTRQSLGISALSLANQAQQGILQLLR